MQYPKSSFFQKRGRNGILSFKQSSNQAIKQSSNQAIKQRYHTFITIYPFTKDRLKIPYFLLFSLLFPLSLTLLFPLSLTRTIFLKNLIR
ncbi:hypothetical protein BB423_05175 [Helicobacter pylori]|uniref:hypothetical protein n=1 Tax=Helicobacter pylori TaxID=210 RepID=UPI000BEB3239|nr:hypothetical protein BB423_05175 [Helicobacter pylori]